MCPYIHIFQLSIPVYGIMTLLGMTVAVGVVALQCKYHNYSRQEALLAALIALAGSIAGLFLLGPVTKLPDIIINWDKYSKIPLGDFLSWFVGDIVFYGGLIGGVIAVVLYCRYFKMSFLSIADVCAPAIPAGHAIGRVGCLMAGCCYGIEVSHSNPLAIIYPERTDGLALVAAPAGIPVLAMPLIEAGGNIVIMCIILLFQRRNKVTGRGIAVYGILYSVQRFALEFFRGDLLRGVYRGVSTSQIISVVVFVVSVLCFFYASRISRIKPDRGAAQPG